MPFKNPQFWPYQGRPTYELVIFTIFRDWVKINHISGPVSSPQSHFDMNSIFPFIRVKKIFYIITGTIQ